MINLDQLIFQDSHDDNEGIIHFDEAHEELDLIFEIYFRSSDEDDKNIVLKTLNLILEICFEIQRNILNQKEEPKTMKQKKK